MNARSRAVACLIALLFLAPLVAAAAGGGSPLGAEDALKRLLDGNKRFRDGKLGHPHQSADARSEVARAQHPFAAIICCSDSRVPPEILFDQGLGDLFVVRLAGNIVDDAALGSVEYAVDHLGVRFVMVLGHERCGAVTAAVSNGDAPGYVRNVVRAIAPAVKKTRKKPGEPVENAMRENVRLGVERLRAAKPILRELAESGKLKVAGARYDLDTGLVEVIP